MMVRFLFSCVDISMQSSDNYICIIFLFLKDESVRFLKVEVQFFII